MVNHEKLIIHSRQNTLKRVLFPALPGRCLLLHLHYDRFFSSINHRCRGRRIYIVLKFLAGDITSFAWHRNLLR